MPLLKVCLLGALRVGKTEVLHALCDNQPDFSREYEATGRQASFAGYRVPLRNSDHAAIVQMWDMTGSSTSGKASRTPAFQDAHLAVAVIDVTKHASLAGLLPMLREFVKASAAHAKSNSVGVVVLLNKQDMTHASPAMNVVTEEDVRTKLKRFGKFILDVVPVSCESGLNLPTAKERVTELAAEMEHNRRVGPAPPPQEEKEKQAEVEHDTAAAQEHTQESQEEAASATQAAEHVLRDIIESVVSEESEDRRDITPPTHDSTPPPQGALAAVGNTDTFLTAVPDQQDAKEGMPEGIALDVLEVDDEEEGERQLADSEADFLNSLEDTVGATFKLDSMITFFMEFVGRTGLAPADSLTSKMNFDMFNTLLGLVEHNIYQAVADRLFAAMSRYSASRIRARIAQNALDHTQPPRGHHFSDRLTGERASVKIKKSKVNPNRVAMQAVAPTPPSPSLSPHAESKAKMQSPSSSSSSSETSTRGGGPRGVTFETFFLSMHLLIHGSTVDRADIVYDVYDSYGTPTCLNEDGDPVLGHNPLGSASVLAAVANASASTATSTQSASASLSTSSSPEPILNPDSHLELYEEDMPASCITRENAVLVTLKIAAAAPQLMDLLQRGQTFVSMHAKLLPAAVQAVDTLYAHMHKEKQVCITRDEFATGVVLRPSLILCFAFDRPDMLPM